LFVVCVPAAPRHLDVQRIREDLLKLEDVQSVDELNVWALTSDKTAALVHLQLCESPRHTHTHTAHAVPSYPCSSRAC